MLPDPPDFVKGSILRDASGNPTGVIRGDIAATRPVAATASEDCPGAARGGQPGARQRHEPRGPHSPLAWPVAMQTCWRFSNDGRRRDGSTSGCFASAALRRHARAGRPIHQQIAQMKLFQGDEYIDNVVFGESVYTPLHDRMFAVKSTRNPSSSSSGTRWRWKSPEPACRCMCTRS